MLVPIADADDARLRDYLHLTDVALRTRTEPEEGLYMAESREVITRAVEAGHTPRSFLLAPKWLPTMRGVLAAAGGDEDGGGIPVYLAEASVVRSVTGYRVHRGALAAMNRPRPSLPGEALADARRVAILENLVDHTNVGAIFRSAAALGVDALAVTPRCADPLYRRSVRVSMGTVFQVPWTRLEVWPDIDLLHALGYSVVALTLTPEAVALDEFAASQWCTAPGARLALVLGAEGDGLSPCTVSACDVEVRIPMQRGVDSLNVAAASAVAFWATRGVG